MVLNRRQIIICKWSLVATSLLIVSWYYASCQLIIHRIKPQSQGNNSLFLDIAGVVTSSENVTNRVIIHSGDTVRLKQANEVLPWLSHRQLPRILSRRQRDRCIELLAQVDAILSAFNITYMLAYGTLLGSYVMHDMLPWDDDIDIFMNIDDLPNIRRLFNDNSSGHHDQIRLLESRNTVAFTAKLYSLTDPKAGKYAWHWPYIDISFYTERRSRVLSYMNDPNWRIDRTEFFPLTQRVLAWRWFPAPRNTGAFIKLKYRRFVCKSHGWDHVNEISRGRVYSVDCKQLASTYPFVVRKISCNETTESLVLNGKSLYTIPINNGG